MHGKPSIMVVMREYIHLMTLLKLQKSMMNLSKLLINGGKSGQEHPKRNVRRKKLIPINPHHSILEMDPILPLGQLPPRKIKISKTYISKSKSRPSQISPHPAKDPEREVSKPSHNQNPKILSQIPQKNNQIYSPHKPSIKKYQTLLRKIKRKKSNFLEMKRRWRSSMSRITIPHTSTMRILMLWVRTLI